MRKQRCNQCGVFFYTAKHDVRSCQNCSNTQPDKTEQQAKEAAAKKNAAANPAGEPQTFPLDKLKDDDVQQSIPKRKARKPKTDDQSDEKPAA